MVINVSNRVSVTPFSSRSKSTRDDWQTPKAIVDALGHFDLDPCANINNPFRLAAVGYPVGGLILPWHGRIWCNPPYGSECRLWLRKLAKHEGGGVALIPPRVGSKWFQEEVLETCNAILFIKGRISFLDQDLKPVTGNNADSVLIAYGFENVAALLTCGLPGKLWVMR